MRRNWKQFEYALAVVRYDELGRIELFGVDGSVRAVPSAPSALLYPAGSLVRTHAVCGEMPSFGRDPLTVSVLCDVLDARSIGPALLHHRSLHCKEARWSWKRQHRLAGVERCADGLFGLFSSRWVIGCSGPGTYGRWEYQWHGEWTVPQRHPLSRTSVVSTKGTVPAFLSPAGCKGTVLAELCENKTPVPDVRTEFDSRACQVEPSLHETLVSEGLLVS